MARPDIEYEKDDANNTYGNKLTFQENPKTIQLLSYVKNNITRLTDPKHCSISLGTTWQR